MFLFKNENILCFLFVLSKCIKNRKDSLQNRPEDACGPWTVGVPSPFWSHRRPLADFEKNPYCFLMIFLWRPRRAPGEVDAHKVVSGRKKGGTRRVFWTKEAALWSHSSMGFAKKRKKNQKNEAKHEKQEKKRYALQLARLTLFWGVSARLGSGPPWPVQGVIGEKVAFF